MAETKETCGSCKYWLPFPSKPEGQGECRRYAPRPPGMEATKWPKTMTADWCGEYKSGGARRLTQQSVDEPLTPQKGDTDLDSPNTP
jgi:hypothetical protein